MSAASEVGFYVPGVAAALSVLSCRALSPAARWLGWVDKPGVRKPHQGEVPVVGGLAVVFAFLGAWLVLGPAGFRPGWLEVCAGLMLLLGVVDDRFPLSSRVRFSVQIVVALVMCWLGGAVLRDLGSLVGPELVPLGRWAVPMTVFATVGLINAFNMVDGMDGLAGTLFVISASALAACALAAGRVDGLVLLPLAGAVVGFLLVNARFPWNARARVFMGDAGSLCLGFCLAWFTVSLSQPLGQPMGQGLGHGADRALAPVTAVWLCAVPLLDAGSLIIRRLQAGRAPFHGDLQHLHHLFLRAGFSVRATWLLISAFAAALAGVGLAAEFLAVPEAARFWSFLALAAVYHWRMVLACKRGAFLGRRLAPCVPRPKADSQAARA